MDATTKALIETIGATGYAVMVGADSDGNNVIEAMDKETGETFVVRADDLYMAVVDAQIGISTLRTAKTARARNQTTRLLPCAASAAC